MAKRATIFPPAMRFTLPALCCAALAASLSVTASAQTWSPVTYIGSYDEEFPSAPSFDPAGDAWVGLSYFNQSTLQHTLQVVESNGASGTWQQPVTLFQTGDEIWGGPNTIADHLGAVTVLYSFVPGGMYQLQSFRYVPGQGWQGPVTAYSSPNFMAVVGSAVDSNNNLVIVFCEGSPSGNIPPYSTWSIVYSSATGTWGTPQMLSSPNASTLLWSLASDPSGANIMLVYTSAIGPAQDIYSWKYVPATQSWVGAALPGTSKREFLEPNGVTDFGHFPLAVDSSGNATLLADYVINGPDGICTVYGFRYENGKWGEGVELLPLQHADEAIDYLGAIAVDSSGIVVGAMSTSRDGGVVEAFRYTPDTGWDTEIAAGSPMSYALTAVAFLGSTPGEAVIVYYSETGLPSSSVYLNGVWSPTVPTTNVSTGSFSLEQAPGGQDLLLFQSAMTPDGTTWLNP
jgi:hypothetical protein